MNLAPLGKEARAELQRRYERKQWADDQLAAYLLPILHDRDIPPDRWEGFDDETGEIILTPEPVSSPG